MGAVLELRRLGKAAEEAWGRIRRGWCLGDPEFKQELLEELQGGFGDHHSGIARRLDMGTGSNAANCIAIE